jgi:LmbE family N-acetylglucosaminyl deacetylase
VLAKYAAEGVRVYLAVATDGSLGVAEHAGLPAGAELATARARELQCAAERLGLQPPVMFQLEDQLRMGAGLAAHAEQINELRSRVRQLFEQLQPDAVITWPASGWTGHPDHRLVSSIVTEVFQSQPWKRPTRLYYPAAPVGRLPPSHPLSAAAVDSRWLGVEVTVSPAEYAKAKQAWLCHQSQYTPAMIEQLHQSLLATQRGTAQFIALPQPRGKATSLLRN